MFIRSPGKGPFPSVHVDEKKLNGKKQNKQNVDLDEPTSLLDHVNLGCIQRECKPNAIVIKECRQMFESRLSATATGKLPGWEKPHAQTVAWSYDMEGNAQKNVLSDTVNWYFKKRCNCTKFPTPCWDDHNFNKEGLETI